MPKPSVGTMDEFFGLMAKPEEGAKGIAVVKEVCDRWMNIDYQTKSIHIKALQLVPENFKILRNWCDIEISEEDCSAIVQTFFGEKPAGKLDWITKDDNGKVVLCSPDVFTALYQQAPGQFLFA